MKSIRSGNKESRHGKHAPDNVILGMFVKPEVKALAMIVAGMKGCDVSALLIDGINYHAAEQGVMRDGQILPEFELEIRAVAARLRENKRKKQQNRNKEDAI